MACRICNNATKTVLDLGATPPANSLLTNKNDEIKFHSLVLEYCGSCGNLQLRDCLNSDDLYKHYFYVTPKSNTLDSHYDYLTSFLLSRDYVNRHSFVVEVGSNIGAYLKFIKPNVKSIMGIDPAENIAAEANKNGINTVCEFFGQDSASRIKSTYGTADTIIARHCFAHNSSPHDLLRGVTALLSSNGTLVVENAYAVNTIEGNEFDQIYHEHMFYYSIQSMSKALAMHGLLLVDVLISLVHGGSICFIAKRAESNPTVMDSIETHLAYEKAVLNESSLLNFASNAYRLKLELTNHIKMLVASGKTIYTYGATAKGNTLLNFAGLTHKEIKYCVDSTDIKLNKFLPGSGIKIISEQDGVDSPPDYYLLTAWNYKDEIITKVRNSGNYKTAFIVPFPKLSVV
jgi:SAM-dependent methyltransferase